MNRSRGRKTRLRRTAHTLRRLSCEWNVVWFHSLMRDSTRRKLQLSTSLPRLRRALSDPTLSPRDLALIQSRIADLEERGRRRQRLGRSRRLGQQTRVSWMPAPYRVTRTKNPDPRVRAIESFSPRGTSGGVNRLS